VDYVYNHAVGLPFTRTDYELRRDSTTLNAAAARTKINTVTGGVPVDQWIANNPTKNISAFGLINDTIFPGLYPDMTRARFIVGGFTKYRGLQFNLHGQLRNSWKFKNVGYNASYAWGRNESSSTVGRIEFIATSDCNRNWNDKACFGPSGLDRTSNLSTAFYMTVPGGIRLNSFWSYRTTAPQNLYVPQFGGATSSTNSVFANDLQGDNFQDRLPGVGAGQFGRGVKNFEDLNKIITQWNSTQAGQITAHGKALVAAGLFTEAQLKKLGAVSSTIPLVPMSNPWPWHDIFRADLRVDRPIRIKERFEVIPFADIYNLFNHAPAGTYGGLGATFGSLNFDYAAGAKNGQAASDLDITRGRNTGTRRVMIGIRATF
jgi:hypothetical protein